METEKRHRPGLLALPHLDWHAYFVAGLVASLTTLLAGLVLCEVILGEPTFILRITASLVLGPEVIPVTEGTTALILLVGLVLHFTLTFAYAFLIVLVIYRWGLAVGLVGGALLGLALYVIDIYALSYFFPWIYPLRNWLLLLTHMMLGGLVGVAYELLDQYDLPFPVSNT
ncbi:MAG: hypothetical protein E4G90_02155 [Gemmatimonadales bacterium]|nr:MAG: hypothetical protein E4G90_02155 [Gemmatimonadales bacterium]